MKHSSYQHIDWKCFVRHTENDTNLQKEILGLFHLFLTRLPQDINIALKAHSDASLRKIVHKAKPTLYIFGCERLVQSLEQILVAIQSEQDSLRIMQEIRQMCREILLELAQYTEMSAAS